MEERTILIIEDSEADRAMLRRQLGDDSTCTYRFIEEAGMEKGLERLRESQPDCVVLDYFLPDGDGVKFIEAIKDEGGRVGVPVIVLTASGSEEIAAACLRAGAHDYLTKSRAETDALRMAINNAIYRVKADRQLDEQRLELERLYEAAQLHNAELQEAKESAERANAVKDEFLAMLSHELRTPLTPILSLVSATLAEPQLTPDLKETFTLIQRNVQLEARLIDDLLDLTRITNGRLEIQKEAVDLHACVQAAIDLCQALLDSRRVALHTELLAVGTVLGDFARIQQALWNLLKSVIETTPAGGRVELFSREEDGMALVEVSGNASDARAEQALKEPKPLYAHLATNGGIPDSLGLELSIARAVAEAHRGELHVETDEATSTTTFCFKIPMQDSPSAAGAPVQVQRVARAMRGKTILVVEDHEDTRRVLSRALRRRGYGVTAAASVEAACEQYRHQPADLVICDIGLPDGTGWDVMQRLREMGDVKAVAVSGYGMDQDLARSRDVGFLAHLTKPVDFPRLEMTIAKILEEAEQASVSTR